MTKWCIDVKLVFNVYMKTWFLSKMIHSKYLRFKIWLIFVLKVTHYILHDPVDCAHACPLLQIVAPPPSPPPLSCSCQRSTLQYPDTGLVAKLQFARFRSFPGCHGCWVTRVPCPVPTGANMMSAMASRCLALVPNFYLIPAHAFGDIYIYYV